MIVFELCNEKERPDCKSREEMKQWMQSKYIFVQQNEIIYRHEERQIEQRAERHSSIVMHPLSNATRIDHVQMVQISQVRFNRIPFGMDDERENDEFFSILEQPARILPYENLFWNSITYEMSEQRKVYTRIDYGVLDWLSDIGGLFKVVHTVIFLLISQLFKDGPTLFLTSMLVDQEKPTPSPSQKRRTR